MMGLDNMISKFPSFTSLEVSFPMCKTRGGCAWQSLNSSPDLDLWPSQLALNYNPVQFYVPKASWRGYSALCRGGPHLSVFSWLDAGFISWLLGIHIGLFHFSKDGSHVWQLEGDMARDVHFGKSSLLPVPHSPPISPKEPLCFFTIEILFPSHHRQPPMLKE